MSHKNRPREAMVALYLRSFEEAVQQGRFFVGHECDSQEPSLWDAGFPVMHIAAFPCLFCGAQPTRAAVGGGPYGKFESFPS